MKAALGATLPYFTDGEALCLSPQELQYPGSVLCLCAPWYTKVTLLTRNQYHPHSTSEKTEAFVSRQLAQDYTAHLTMVPPKSLPATVVGTGLPVCMPPTLTPAHVPRPQRNLWSGLEWLRVSEERVLGPATPPLPQ